MAEELTQEVFLKVHRFRDSYDEKYALSTWLWTIARNTVADYLRAVRGGADDGFGDTGEESPWLDELPSPDPCAESLVMKKDQRRTLMKMMRSLTRLQRRVLWMRIIHQLSYDEISRRMGMSLSAVKNLAHRAKRTLTADFELSPSFA